MQVRARHVADEHQTLDGAQQRSLAELLACGDPRRPQEPFDAGGQTACRDLILGCLQQLARKPVIGPVAGGDTVPERGRAGGVRSASEVQRPASARG